MANLVLNRRTLLLNAVMLPLYARAGMAPGRPSDDPQTPPG